MLTVERGVRFLLVLFTLTVMACQAPAPGDAAHGAATGRPAEPAGEPEALSPGRESQAACDCPLPPESSCPAALPVPACPKPAVTDRKHYAGKLVVGENEFVYIEPGPLKLRARVDSGATTSSLHAGDVVRFERDGEAWVRFTTWASKAEPVTLELPISRRVRIKTKTEAIDRRVVVEVNLRVGDVTQLVEVTLADRDNFDYPVLIGRNYLRDVAVIDVSRSYIHGR